jgi:hypothetical protein
MDLTLGYYIIAAVIVMVVASWLELAITITQAALTSVEIKKKMIIIHVK